ncbi:MAG: hypothetical protein IPN95_28905 [Bacteroidetes bacterium]|nr:hypothetical protein [Bacteroidota bacterium]
METINLQLKTEAEKGTAEKYWFENEFTGLQRTLFHRVYIPLKPFNSGLDYEEKPLETIIVMEWLNLNLSDPDNLDNLSLKSTPEDGIEVSIYLGCAHNPCNIIAMNWKRISTNSYAVVGELLIDFEFERVAKNEFFKFETTIVFDTKTIE